MADPARPSEQSSHQRVAVCDGCAEPKTLCVWEGDAVLCPTCVQESHDDLVASARVYHVIADPEMAADGADPWIVGSTFEGDYSREHVESIVSALLKEGLIVADGDGQLRPAPYEAGT